MLRTFFVRLSENPWLRNFAERSSLGRRVSGRFVAGTEIADAVRATQKMNRAGMSVSIDNLGENVTNPDEARHSAQLYLRILDAITANQLNANISLKLTHMGLDVDEKLARDIVSGLVAKAASLNPPGFVRVDMEGSPYTQRTLDLVFGMHERFSNCGVVLQSYLYRTPEDVLRANAAKVRVRLVKGAYDEPPTVAFAKKADVDAKYESEMRELLLNGVYPAIATHDDRLIESTKQFARERAIASDRFEFQMLYGIRRDLQDRLLREGYRVRIYVPYGTEWYPYLMRRLAERPANLLFIVRSLIRERRAA
jgi:proline dehydrogenase